METTKLKRFAQYARRSLLEQVSAKLKLVLSEDSAARRESPEAVKKLEKAILSDTKDQVIERVAYIWFNRFCALRFMDVNRYNRVGIVSPADPGQFQPEILAEAKMGHIDEEMVPEKIRQQIFALLGGTAPSQDPQAEAYRLLVVAACNDYHKAMPYLFERIADYTELLMSDDLLSGNSILANTREAMTPDMCQDVEVIGWLYQFYISEKKDKVFDDLKKNKKITPENIPAATQLFTPHWIVRYLVENSLGRLWMLNRPNSTLFEKMEYYIHPEDVEIDFLRINKAEDLKIVDPACGSGHMLVYAFDLLYAIYEEEGVDPSEIPEKILTHNLFGIEIDERAGELAAFALTMKARAKQRRFFRKPVQPNICVLQAIHFDEIEINEYMDFVGQDIFTLGLKVTLSQFEEADNFGSLIRPELTNVQGMLEILEVKDVSSHLFYSLTHEKVLQVLKQADYLSPKYHIVIANPPYMGFKSTNTSLNSFLTAHYSDCKNDLYACFIQQNERLCLPSGYFSMITQQSWWFISSYKKLRNTILKNNTIINALHLGSGAFQEISGDVVQSIAFVIKKIKPVSGETFFVKLTHSRDKQHDFFNKTNYFLINTALFLELEDCQFSYWLSNNYYEVFKWPKLSTFTISDGQTLTGNNELYLKYLWEVSSNKIGIGEKWALHAKGGMYRKWAGNVENVIDWSIEAVEFYRSSKVGRIIKEYLWFKKGICWSLITTDRTAFRILDESTISNLASPVFFLKSEDMYLYILGFLNTKIVNVICNVFNPTMSLTIGDIQNLPIKYDKSFNSNAIRMCLDFNHNDWSDIETSRNFHRFSLLQPDYRQVTLKATYKYLRAHWQEITLEMQRLEQENNRIFIDIYGLQDELTPDVPLNEITLTCNPHYRYGNNKNEEELEALLLADTMKEFISYAVGCMFGRYALDKPGLILANQGETIADYLKQIPEPIFSADDDNVIPMLDGDWFTDDVTERFGQFLKVTFGDAHYEENLKFIEQALGKDIRKYFLKDFYTDHLKRYKKRPIYWLFSSPKGTFNALIYMHRYRPDTVSVVLNDYLREFRTKLSAHKNHLEAVSISSNASAGEKTKALKDIESHRKMIDELDVYEREVLYPLATEQIEIDLDDGVKVNYQKFGEALKKIPGLAAKED